MPRTPATSRLRLPANLPDHIRRQLAEAGVSEADVYPGPRPRRLREAPPDNPYEDTEQRDLFARINTICYHPAASARWPKWRKIFAVPNGGKRDAALGRWLKEQGTRKGVWDIWAPVRRPDPAAPDGVWSGQIIELKRRRGNTVSRRANDDAPWWSQLEWYRMLQDEGYKLTECRGGAAAWDTLAAYFGDVELVGMYDEILTGRVFAREL